MRNMVTDCRARDNFISKYPDHFHLINFKATVVKIIYYILNRITLSLSLHQIVLFPIKRCEQHPQVLISYICSLVNQETSYTKTRLQYQNNSELLCTRSTENNMVLGVQVTLYIFLGRFCLDNRLNTILNRCKIIKRQVIIIIFTFQCHLIGISFICRKANSVYFYVHFALNYYPYIDTNII